MRWFVLMILTLFLISLSSVFAVETVQNTTYINHFLANSTGENNITGDYSSNPTAFFIRPPHNETWEIARMIVTIKDSSISSFDNYGAISGGLVNGMELFISKNGTNVSISKSKKTNGDWGSSIYDVTITGASAGEDYLWARWTFSNSGKPLKLFGANNDFLYIEAKDDLTALTEHKYLIQGQKVVDTVTGEEMIGAAILVVFAFLLVFFIFREINNDENKFLYIKEFGYMFALFIATAGISLAVSYIGGSSSQQLHSIQSIFRPYLFFSYAFMGIMSVIILWRLGRGTFKKLTELPFRNKR